MNAAIALESVEVLRGGHLSNLGLVEALVRSGSVPLVLAPEFGPVRDALESHPHIASPVLDRRTLRNFARDPYGALRQWRSIAGHLRGEAIDVVQCDFEMLGAVAPAARMAGARIVVVLRSRLVDSKRFAAAMKLRSVDAVVVLTPRARDDLRDTGWRGPVSVIPNAVQPAIMRRLLEVPLPQTANMRKALVVGALVPDKGQLDLLRALRADSGLDVVRFVGSLPDGRHAFALASERERLAGHGLTVEFWGHTEAVTEHYAWSDVVLVPSRREGLSRVAVEAQLAGRPIVSRDFLGADEALMPGNRMVRTAQLHSWTSTLEDMRATTARTAELQRARDYARQKHDARTCAERTLEVWRRVAEG